MIAIITEKPSVARDIANVLGVLKKKEGYIEGNGYMITWAYGHLVSLALPEEYGFESQKIEDLPFIPEKFMLAPRKIKTKKGYQTDSNATKQLKIIKDVFNKCNKIIVATDAGREGELIFRYIYKYLKCKKPFSRLWISSMTDKAIKDGFQILKDGKDYDNLFLAAEARTQADWLLGINASRALHICSGESNNSLGRVQTPTLALICKRYLDNKRFKAQPYWQTSVNVSKDGINFRVTGNDQYFEKEAADKAFDKIKSCPKLKVLKFNREEKKVETPLLHDLASLQKRANVKHGFSAEKTLSIAQKLYEAKLISYPRTGSKYIPEDVFETIPSLINSLNSYPLFKDVADRFSGKELNLKPVNPDKITDHHALIITENKPAKLSVDEKVIYELIAGRMLEAFSQAGINDSTMVEMVCNEDIILSAQNTSVKYSGWRDIFNEQEEQVKEYNIELPILKEGDILKIESINLVQKSTKPKPLYTEATLLTAMETAGRDSEDKEIKAALSTCGIGTPATRAGIIEILYKRDYICLQNKSLVPTKKGLELYKQIVNLQLADVELTGGWESGLLRIEKDPGYLSSFNGGLKVFTKQVVTELASVISKTDNCNETPYICPKCRLGKVILWPKMAKCNYSKCDFRLYREICGKLLNDNTIKSLIIKRKTTLIKGFKNKDGKTFDARLILDENSHTKFDFSSKC